MEDAVEFLLNPPLDSSIRAGYALLKDAAISTLPARLLEVLGLHRSSYGRVAGKSVTTALRWALGASPSWELALVRSGAEVPEGIFVQPLRVA